MDYLKLLEDIKGDNNMVKIEWINFTNNIKNLDFENFLQNSTIRGTMFFENETINNKQYSTIKEIIGYDLLNKITSISKIGNPNTKIIDNIELNGNIIHHLYHLSRYKKTTDKFLGKNILEWGGGYGNMASLILKMLDIDSYTIIDLPELIILQYHFLGKIFGYQNINIIKHNDINLKKINLVPLSNIDLIDYKLFDTFISTWALTESDICYHDFCNSKSLFDVDNMLLSYHLSGFHVPFMKESLNIDNIISKKNIIKEDIILIPETYYVFK